MNNGTAVSEEQLEETANRVAKSIRLRRLLWPSIAACALAILAIGLFIIRHAGTHVVGERAVRQGLSTPDLIIRITGKTEAVRSRPILAPVLSGQQVGVLSIVKLIPSGARVRQGDILVEFDRAAQVRDYIDKQAQVNDQNGKVLEAVAAEEAARAKDETEIGQAESALSKAKLEMQKLELMSRIDAEKARENLDEAQATSAQLRETFELKRQAAKASIRILEIQRDRTRETMLHSQSNASLMQIRSPIDGIVVYNTIWKQGNMGEVQEGDQVRPGVPFMEVVDPSVMQVHAVVNQQDLFAVRVGQKASVHLDAYPDLALPGHILSIDPMGKHGDFSSKLRVFWATISIEGQDSRLMPDLSAAVDVDGRGGLEAGGTGQ